MTPTALLAIYLTLVLLDLGWTLVLTLLDYRSVRRGGGAVPETLSPAVSEEDGILAAEYSKAKLRFALAHDSVTTAVLLAVSASGLFGALDARICAAFASEYWRCAFFIAAIIAGQAILVTPFELYLTFGLERRFGFNATTPRTWVLDQAKNVSLYIVAGLPLIALYFAFVDGSLRPWWLWATLCYAAFQLGFAVLYPVAIAPLFNRFEPLPAGSLRESVRELCDRLGFPARDILVMDGSRRSTHSNAFFMGFGKSKRIALLDTLLEEASDEELLAVLAHEIGHEKGHHVQQATALSIALSSTAFFLIDRMMGWGTVYAAFGFAAPSKHAILLVFVLLAGLANFLLAPALSAWSRRREYAADAFAVRALGSGDALESALLTQEGANASNLWPHRLYAAWFYSHPPLVERIAAIRALGSTMPARDRRRIPWLELD